MDCAFIVKPKNSLPRVKNVWFQTCLSPKDVLLFFSKSFIILCYTVKSAIHFFCNSFFFIKLGFIFFPYGCSIALLPFVGKTILPPLSCFVPLSKLSWKDMCGSISGFFFPTTLCVYHCQYCRAPAFKAECLVPLASLGEPGQLTLPVFHHLTQ